MVGRKERFQFGAIYRDMTHVSPVGHEVALMAQFKFLHGGFLKWWYPTTIGFPTKNDHFGVFWGYHYFWKHPHRVDYGD